MPYSIAVIGFGNMAKAIISGVLDSSVEIGEIKIFDKAPEQYASFKNNNNYDLKQEKNIADAVNGADMVLLSVKPQNYPEVLSEIAQSRGYDKKLYISIAAGITSQSVSDSLGGADVIRVLPNVPMMIGKGVSVICKNTAVDSEKFNFVCDIFGSAGSNVIIDEEDMNTMIGVTSSSPAYVFRFINAIYEGAVAQGLSDVPSLIKAICDVVIGSAQMLKDSSDPPMELIPKVASKGGTTERALSVLDERGFDSSVIDAMKACTVRANELGAQKK